MINTKWLYPDSTSIYTVCKNIKNNNNIELYYKNGKYAKVFHEASYKNYNLQQHKTRRNTKEIEKFKIRCM